MNNNTNANKITKERIAGAAGLTMTLMATAIGSAMGSPLGASLATIGLVGTGVILGYSMGFKAGRRTAFKEALA